MREIVDAICYVLRGGIAWRLMPDSFPPWGTVYRRFARPRDDGRWEMIDHRLVTQDRERAGREASPTAAVVDGQSVETTESGGEQRGYDGGKKIKGRKRHAMVDTDGRALKPHVHAADIQDRDGAEPLLRASRPRWPFVRLAYADAGYQGPRVAAAGSIRVEIVRKPEAYNGRWSAAQSLGTIAVGSGTGATSTTNWWSQATRTTRAEAHRTARLAKVLEGPASKYSGVL